MNNFSYYTDTQIEYQLALQRLEILENRKMEIWQKYFGVKSPQWDKIGEKGTNTNPDKMVMYLDEISRSKGNKPSLEAEIIRTRNEAQRLDKVLKVMAEKLKSTDSIEGKLYYRIVVEKCSVNKAIREIAAEVYMTENNIWKTYYPKIKADIRKLRKNDEI